MFSGGKTRDFLMFSGGKTRGFLMFSGGKKGNIGLQWHKKSIELMGLLHIHVHEGLYSITSASILMCEPNLQVHINDFWIKTAKKN